MCIYVHMAIHQDLGWLEALWHSRDDHSPELRLVAKGTGRSSFDVILNHGDTMSGDPSGEMGALLVDAMCDNNERRLSYIMPFCRDGSFRTFQCRSRTYTGHMSDDHCADRDNGTYKW